MDPPSVDNKIERSASGLATEGLETQLEMFIENLRQINIMVQDFQPQAQSVLNQKFQKIVTDLREIEKMKKVVKDVQIPLEVCDYVDEGQNPQLYTKHCMSTALKKNEEVKGKIEAYRKFKANLLVETNKFFPEEIERYRAIRTEEEEEDEEDDEEDEEVDVEADMEVTAEPAVQPVAEPDSTSEEVEPEIEPEVESNVEADVEVDVEADAEVDVEADAEADAKVDVEADAEADAEPDAEADAEVDMDVEVDVEMETQEEAVKENGDTHE